MENSRIEEKLDKIDNKLEKLNEVNHKQDIKLAKLDSNDEKNTKILEEHQRRSLASEKRLDHFEGFMKGLGVIVVILGIAATLQRLGVI